MKQQHLPQAQLARLSQDRGCADERAWPAALHTLGITTARHLNIATEGALVGRLVHHGRCAELVIMSDDAGQFKVAGFLQALCWVHAERTIHKLIAGTERNRATQAAGRDQIWTFYHDLKAYQRAPDEITRSALAQRFDDLFTQQTTVQLLNLALKRLYDHKTELLLVLARPDMARHNNLSANDIRDDGKKRKSSATTRRDTGRQARDTFLSLKKTCQKLGSSFWQYLQDRISQQHDIPPLPELIRATAQGP